MGTICRDAVCDSFPIRAIRVIRGQPSFIDNWTGAVRGSLARYHHLRGGGARSRIARRRGIVRARKEIGRYHPVSWAEREGSWDRRGVCGVARWLDCDVSACDWRGAADPRAVG